MIARAAIGQATPEWVSPALIDTDLDYTRIGVA